MLYSRSHAVRGNAYINSMNHTIILVY